MSTRRNLLLLTAAAACLTGCDQMAMTGFKTAPTQAGITDIRLTLQFENVRRVGQTPGGADEWNSIERILKSAAKTVSGRSTLDVRDPDPAPRDSSARPHMMADGKLFVRPVRAELVVSSIETLADVHRKLAGLASTPQPAPFHRTMLKLSDPVAALCYRTSNEFVRREITLTGFTTAGATVVLMTPDGPDRFQATGDGTWSRSTPIAQNDGWVYGYTIDATKNATNHFRISILTGQWEPLTKADFERIHPTRQ
jgi:hypothetical protein